MCVYDLWLTGIKTACDVWRLSVVSDHRPSCQCFAAGLLSDLCTWRRRYTGEDDDKRLVSPCCPSHCWLLMLGNFIALAAHTPSRSHVRCAVLLNSQDLTAKDRELSYDASASVFVWHPLKMFPYVRSRHGKQKAHWTKGQNSYVGCWKLLHNSPMNESR